MKTAFYQKNISSQPLAGAVLISPCRKGEGADLVEESSTDFLSAFGFRVEDWVRKVPLVEKVSRL